MAELQIQITYRGLDVPQDYFVVYEGPLKNWKAGVDAALGEVTAEALSAGTAPRVFAQTEDVPEDVKKLRLADGSIAIRAGDSGWNYGVESDSSPRHRYGWTGFYPDEAPMTEILEDPPTYKVGDPDPTLEISGGRICDKSHNGWVCTWPKDHTGNHVAGDSVQILDVW